MGRKKKPAPKPTIPAGLALTVGSTVTCLTSYGVENSDPGRLMTGRVIYIHPRGRFYTVEFTVGERTFRENYFTGALQGPERMDKHEDDKHIKS